MLIDGSTDMLEGGWMVISFLLATLIVNNPSSASGSKLKSKTLDMHAYSVDMSSGRIISKSPKVSGIVMAFKFATDSSRSTFPGLKA